jgi:hypothetical protein
LRYLPAVGSAARFSGNNPTLTGFSPKSEVRILPRISGFTTPKHRKHKASGQAVVTIAGRDHYLGPWRSRISHVEYDRLIGE